MEVDPGATTEEKGDSIGPLEAVAKGVKSQKLSKMASPKSHSRSSSHDSYFEKGAANNRVAPSSNDNAVKFGEEGIDDEDEELDISEIQMNFELEENEMRIFSEDEAMLSCSVGSDLSRQLGASSSGNHHSEGGATVTGSAAVAAASHHLLSANESPKARMSFREKLKRFTSPNSNRKTGASETGPLGGSTTLKDKLVGALSPESLRKRSEVLLAEKAAKSDRDTSVVVSPSKKKKSTFSPSGSPSSNTSDGLKVKRSKIADEGDLEKKEGEGLQADPPLMIPLSPSIKFMDESTDSTTKINTIGGGGDTTEESIEVARSEGVKFGDGKEAFSKCRFSASSSVDVEDEGGVDDQP